MPYTANGTTSCVTADTKSTSLLKTTLTWTATQSSTLSTQTWSYTGTVVGATPLPSVANLPTQSVYDVDEQDPKGWTYCYVHGENNVIGSDYVSYYAGSMFDLLYHQCEQKAGAQAPVGVVSAASFLLDETTSYIDSPKTQSPDPPKSDSERTSKAPSSVLVDPFETKTEQTDAPEVTSTGQTNDDSSATTKPTQSGASRTGTHVESASTYRDSVPTEPAKPSSASRTSPGDAEDSHTTAGDDEDTANAGVVQVTATDDRQPTSSRAPGSTADLDSAPNANPATSTQAIASSNSGNLDALNSLIHEVGQLHSSGQAGSVQNTAEQPLQTGQATEPMATASPRPAPIVVGSTTVTANSDGHYMIGTHALQPTESAYENQGVFYSIDTSANALVVDQTATFAIQTALPGQDAPSPANSGSGVAPALANSDADGSSTTRGLGDYVWAGIAGATQAGGQGASSLTDTQGPKVVQTDTGFAYYVSPINTWTASDGNIVVETTTIVASPPMYPVSTWTASDGEIIVESSAAGVNPAVSTNSLSTASDGRVSLENTAVPASETLRSVSVKITTLTASDGKVIVETSSVLPSQVPLSVQVITSTASDGRIVVESRTIESSAAQHSSASPTISLSAISTSTASDGRVIVVNTPVEPSSRATAQSTATTSSDDTAAQQSSNTKTEAKTSSRTGTPDSSSSASLSSATDESGAASRQAINRAHVALTIVMSISILLLQHL